MVLEAQAALDAQEAADEGAEEGAPAADGDVAMEGQ